MDKIVNTINNLTINNTGYEFNTANFRDAQGNPMSNPDIVTHASNGILDQKLLSFRNFGEVFVLPLLTNPTIRLAQQKILTPVVKYIFSDATSGNVWTNRTLRKINRTGIYGSIPVSTPIHSGMSKYSTPASSDSTETKGTRTRIPIGTTAPTCGLNVKHKIDNIRQYTTPYLGKSNKLDTSIDG